MTSDNPPSLPSAAELFEHAACGLLITSTDGRIKCVNDTFCRWLGYESADLVDKKRLSDLLTMGGKVFHQTHWSPLLQIQRSVAEVKLDLIHHDGHTVPMLLNAFRRDHGDVPGENVLDEVAAIVVADRHKYERELLESRKNAEAAEERLRQLNAELSRTDRFKDEFLATLAHELRNPLAPMLNALAVLRLKDSVDAEMEEYYEMLERQLTQMTYLVDDLMEVSRITQGKLQLRKEHVLLGDILRGAMEGAAPLIEKASHRLIVDIPVGKVPVYVDPLRLTQSVLNLLTNAAKYTPDGGGIWLTASVLDGRIAISVRDSGIGIADENLQNVFTMFSQVAAPIERSQGGLGVGLALVKGIIELHGGTIAARSMGLQQGSEFVIELPTGVDHPEAAAEAPLDEMPETPVATPANLKTANVKSAHEKLHRRRILVVDDNQDAANSLAKILGMFDQEVAVAFDGNTAVQLAGQLQPHVIILDIGLPGINGYEAARMIREAVWGSHVLLIAITGWGQPEDKRAAFDAGFDVHMTKPVDPSELKTILQENSIAGTWLQDRPSPFPA